MKGDLVYLEMNEANRQLSHIFDCLEYAHSVINTGFNGEINSDYTAREVVKIQSDICSHIHNAMDGIVDLMGAYAKLKALEK